MIVSSASYSPRRARALGAYAWIEKPFRVEQLLQTVELALGEQEARGRQPAEERDERP